MRKVIAVNPDGTDKDVVVDNGGLVGDPDRIFRLVTSSYIAGGGDSYPMPRFKSENAARFNYVTLDTTSGNQGFTDPGREQYVFAEFVKAVYPASGPGYALPDTAADKDARIKSIKVP